MHYQCWQAGCGPNLTLPKDKHNERGKGQDLTLRVAQTELDIYQAWYNQIRTHQNLAGLTPAEVWKGKRKKNAEKAQWVSAWHGVLCGYYVPE